MNHENENQISFTGFLALFPFAEYLKNEFRIGIPALPSQLFPFLLVCFFQSCPFIFIFHLDLLVAGGSLFRSKLLSHHGNALDIIICYIIIFALQIDGGKNKGAQGGLFYYWAKTTIRIE